MKFVKMHGIGNDFIIIDNLDEKIDFTSGNFDNIVTATCSRRTGIGADGVIFICPSDVADFKMRIFNSDASEAKMCGNGIRCLAVYAGEKNGTGMEHQVLIETLSGTMKVNLSKEDLCTKAEVNMGKAFFEAARMPVSGEMPFTDPVKFGKESLVVSCVSMGNPHTVIFEEDNPGLDMDNDQEFFRLGRLIEHAEFFPDRTNVEFVRLMDRHAASVRVWERGAGETLGCGTGACAVAAILNKRYSSDQVRIIMKGGELQVTVSREGDFFLSGPVETVYEGNCDKFDQLRRK